jgi:hypothetical protein
MFHKLVLFSTLINTSISFRKLLCGFTPLNIYNIIKYSHLPITNDKDVNHRRFEVDSSEDVTVHVPLQIFKEINNDYNQGMLHSEEQKGIIPKNTKKLISISPGGLKGFYMMGIVSYIKEHFDLSDFIFSGASAGSWNAILFSYNGNLTKLINIIIDEKSKIESTETIHDFELWLKQCILDNSKNSDYELDRIFIGVTTLNTQPVRCMNSTKKSVFSYSQDNIQKKGIQTSIFSNFSNLEDALNCCIASSHIPFVTGGFIHKYKDDYAFDGGFSRYPYYDGIVPTLHITPSIWSLPKKKSWFNIEDYTTLLYKEKYDFKQIFYQGYQDTKKNKKVLETIFLNKDIK